MLPWWQVSSCNQPLLLCTGRQCFVSLPVLGAIQCFVNWLRS